MSENEMNTSKQPEVKKEKKAPKPAEKKPGIFARIGKWVRELKSELKKVQWPTKKQTVNNTLIVLACVLIVGAVICAFDFVANNAIELLISLLG